LTFSTDNVQSYRFWILNFLSRTGNTGKCKGNSMGGASRKDRKRVACALAK